MKNFFCGQKNEGMRIYGIVHPEDRYNNQIGGMVHPISTNKYDVWREFFGDKPNVPPIEEAVRAYEAIGYKREEFLVVENTKEKLLEFAKNVLLIYGTKESSYV